MEFDLSYSGLIQHRIRQYLYNLTPDTNTRPLSRRVPFPGEQESCFEQEVQELKQEIQANLQELHEETVKSCEEALNKLLCEPSQIAYSMVEEFVDRLLRAEDVQEEWRKFLKKERLEIWLEFKQIAERV